MMNKIKPLLFLAAASPAAGRLRDLATDLPATAFPPLTLPEGGLYECNRVIPSDYEDDIIPKEAIQALLSGFGLDLPGLVKYDVRAHKVCTTCEDANRSWEESRPDSGRVPAGEAMPYCAEGSFASGRTTSGLLLEPIDPMTKAPVVGNLAATVYSFPTNPNPHGAPSSAWPSDPVAEPMSEASGLFAAAAGTYTLIPDVLGNGEDWEGVRSYIVAAVYQASAVPLLLWTEEYLRSSYGGCTTLDGRVAAMGFSEGGYATVAIAHAIDQLGDGHVHTFTGVGSAPIKLASAQMYAFVQLAEGVFPAPHFVARLGNSYSSTNGDLANTNPSNMTLEQNLASEVYLDPADGTKNAREWSRAGLSYEEMYPLFPQPPSGSFVDMMNPRFIEMVLNSYKAGDDDPCNSDFRTDDIDALCEAILDNDLSDILANVDYPVVVCHSPDDDAIFYSNVIDATLNDNLVMIEDLPVVGPLLKPSGDHSTSVLVCNAGFLSVFAADPENWIVRGVSPADDPDGVCVGAGTPGTDPTPNDTTTDASDNDPAADTSKSPTSSPVEADADPGTVPTPNNVTTGAPSTAPSSDNGAAVDTSKSPTSSPVQDPSSAALAASSVSHVVVTMVAASLSMVVAHGNW